MRCGLIGEVGCSWPLAASERRSLQAAALAQKEIGGGVASQSIHSVEMPRVASYPGLPSQLFSQLWKKGYHAFFFHGCEKTCEGRPGYEATSCVEFVMCG